MSPGRPTTLKNMSPRGRPKVIAAGEVRRRAGVIAPDLVRRRGGSVLTGKVLQSIGDDMGETAVIRSVGSWFSCEWSIREIGFMVGVER